MTRLVECRCRSRDVLCAALLYVSTGRRNGRLARRCSRASHVTLVLFPTLLESYSPLSAAKHHDTAYSPQTRPSTNELLHNPIPPYLSLPRLLSTNRTLFPLLQGIPHALSRKVSVRTWDGGKEGDVHASRSYGRMLVRLGHQMRVCRWGIRVLRRVCRGRGSSCRD
jgi:hypothetical protein